MLDSGFKMPDAGRLMLDSRFKIQNAGFRDAGLGRFGGYGFFDSVDAGPLTLRWRLLVREG
jgi:hypothetical protein